MKYLKWLWDNHFEMVMAILAAIAVFAGVIVSVIECSAAEKKREEAVNTYLAQSVDVLAVQSEPIPPEKTRDYFNVQLDHNVQDRIFDKCEKYDISPAIIIAMIKQESNYNTYCLGDDGRAAGLMQIQAKWHLKRMINLNCTDLFNPCQNVTVGVDILAELLDRYDGDMAKALTAYNRGSYSGTITQYARSIMETAQTLTTE